MSLVDDWKLLKDKMLAYAARILTSWLLTIKVLPGNYSPSCTVNGSMPLAEVTIMMGDTQMPGIVAKDNNEGSQYVANETEFRGFSKIFL